ncbi:MAG: (deoxy)nucleoside triphosphate pyrophosphohydrolase [Bacteroidales bacterium]|jgi:8-oxo-dGTP diphosphatase|nr:(deoxy)nucleoside triphosphate pyrophosphohydrolase [Bacteroidales bacterium]
MTRVTCAIIRNEENEVLVVQRGEKSDHPFKWEFPGGKVNDGETEEECIIREIREELSIDIVICERMSEVAYDYGKKHILLIPFVCDTLDELPLLSEHIAFKWITSRELRSIDYSEADIIVADNYLQANIEPDTSYVAIPDTDQSAAIDKELMAMVNNTMGAKEIEWIAASAIENSAIFKKLLDYSFSGDKKLAFHASWVLTKVCDRYPEIIYPYISGIIEKLNKIDNESTQRSFMRIISLTDITRISTKQHGILADHCFTALKSGFSAIAIKAYSMEILYKLAVLYPELVNELSATIFMLQGEGSAGIIARGQMVLKKLAEISNEPPRQKN